MPDSEEPSGSRGVVEIRFSVSNPRYPFVGITQKEDCRVELEKMLPRELEGYAEFFSVTGADPDQVMEYADENELVEPQLIASYENGGLFEFVVTGFCPARDLAELGAIPQEVVSENGDGYICAEVPSVEDAPELIQSFLEEHPTANLVAKRTKDSTSPVLTTEELERAVDERLTDRQHELLLAAYEAGYYDQSSDTTGKEIADAFDISPATLSQHLGAAERKLVSIFVEDNVVSSSG